MTRSLDHSASTTPVAGPAARRPCREVCACVFEYLDGELAPALALAVRAHLAACVGCRSRVAADRALLEVIARAARGGGADAAAPPSLRARIHRALSRAELERATARGGHRRPRPEA